MASPLAQFGFTIYVVGLGMVGGFLGNLVAGMIIRKVPDTSLPYERVRNYTIIFLILLLVLIFGGTAMMIYL